MTEPWIRCKRWVSGGFLSEPKVLDICKGSKITHSITSLKPFNKDLNMLEVFAYAHDQEKKVSGKLLLNTANHLSGNLKQRFLNYRNRRFLNINKPGFKDFEALCRFVAKSLRL